MRRGPVLDDEAWPGSGAARLEFSGDDVLRPDQNHIQVGMARKTADRRRDGDMGTVIAPHDVDGDCDISHAAESVG